MMYICILELTIVLLVFCCLCHCAFVHLLNHELGVTLNSLFSGSFRETSLLFCGHQFVLSFYPQLF